MTDDSIGEAHQFPAELPVGHCSGGTAVDNAGQASGSVLSNPEASVNTRGETNRSGIFSGFFSGNFLAVPTESFEEFTEELKYALTARPTIVHRNAGVTR